MDRNISLQIELIQGARTFVRPLFVIEDYDEHLFHDVSPFHYEALIDSGVHGTRDRRSRSLVRRGARKAVDRHGKAD